MAKITNELVNKVEEKISGEYIGGNKFILYTVSIYTKGVRPSTDGLQVHITLRSVLSDWYNYYGVK